MTAIQPLVETLRTAVPMLVRSAPSSGDYLEGVLSQQHVEQCCTLLSQTLGPPVKAFSQAVTLETRVQKAVDALGGIRRDQCLFLKEVDAQQALYATLWPWASDPTRVTLKVGVSALR